MNGHEMRGHAGAGQSGRSPLFDALAVGHEMSPLVRGPITPVHLMRWSAAIENWHRIHYDQRFAAEHDGLPDLLINGSFKQHVLVQMVRRWAGRDGWLLAIDFQFRKMNRVGETLTAWGRVTSKEERDELGLVHCEIGIRNDAGEESTPGTATVALPLQGGRPVPYPFPEISLDG